MASAPKSVESRPKEITYPSLYFADGNVIIACGNARGTLRTYFRVHQTILSKHSPVFKAILESKSSNGKAETFYDGLVIREFSETANDMAIFLTFLYEPFSPPIPVVEPDVAYLMFGVLCMADKFKVEALKVPILARIKKDWPDDLCEWDERRRFYQTLRNRGDKLFPDPAIAIRVFLLHGKNHLTKMMFYDLATRDREAIYGATLPGYTNHGLGTRWNVLPRDIILKSASNRRRIQQIIVDLTDEETLNEWQCARQKIPCKDHQLRRFLDVQKVALLSPDPLSALEMTLDLADVIHGQEGQKSPVCESCHLDWGKRLARKRSEVLSSISLMIQM